MLMDEFNEKAYPELEYLSVVEGDRGGVRESREDKVLLLWSAGRHGTRLRVQRYAWIHTVDLDLIAKHFL